MRQPARPVLLALLLTAIVLTHASAQSIQKPATATISGRVTVGSEGLPNITVLLVSSDTEQRRRGDVAKAVTDYEGRYKLTQVAAGSYSLTPSAPAFIGPNEGMYGEMGRTINIAEGETVENMDFSLKRGGVITGRVLDADGAPVVSERVQLEYADKSQRQRRFSPFINPSMYETDDRGIYRLYGLPVGRYTISVGESGQDGYVSFNTAKGGYYARTFHPATTEESKATVIEVTEGSEITNVDITLGRLGQVYSATGRVIDENGKPVANVSVGNGSLTKNQEMITSFGFGSMTDAEGRFRLTSLSPGRYAAFVWNEGQMDSYTEPLKFEIAEGDVSGLELKLRRGASISGVAVIEGTTDKAALNQLTQLSIIAVRATEDRLQIPNFSPAKVAPDGSFRIMGLRPGKVRIHSGNYPPLKGFSMPRIERDGVPVQEVEVAAGAEVTNIRVVFQYGTGRVRGLVKVENGTLPQGAIMFVAARRLGEGSGITLRNARVDSRGHFVLEGLPTGEYEINLHTMIMADTARRLPLVKQRVSVTNDAEAETMLTLDLSAKPTEGSNNE